jgi:DNA recombination protein RmuC
MNEIHILLVFLIFLVAGLGVLVVYRTRPQGDSNLVLDIKLLQQEVGKLEPLLSRELRGNRDELTKGNADNREEMSRGNKAIEDQLEKIRKTVEERLEKLQSDNAQKLEKMRETVDEKLQSTLEKRLNDSFRLVSERLEQVHKGLGDMQTLATGVGDLKRVLSNVKTRGILGEIQLGSLLESVLTPEQFERNVVTKPGSRENVEFAIKLPGRDGVDQVYLPIDSKFPAELYERLVQCYEKGDVAQIDTAAKELTNEIKKQAKSIREKYIQTPQTTDFGILFLPFEGLYAEVVRQPQLVESLQREQKIIVAGPTTLGALLNSLQMGFRTLAIEKRSSEIWLILAEVKKEFEKFGGVLEKAKEKIAGAGKDLDELVGARTKKIQKQFKNLESLPAPEKGEVALPVGLDDEE